MMNPLMVGAVRKRPLKCKFGECNGEDFGSKRKVRHAFKQLMNEKVINELSHKNFAPQRKMK